MHLKWNNTFSRVLASSVAALVVSTSLYAIPKDPCEAPSQPMCCDEPKPGPFAFAYPYDMNLNCPRDFYIHIDSLFMQAKQDGMEFAIHDSSTPATNSPITHGRVEGFSSHSHDWHYNPGMRAGLGFYLDHDAWQVDFNWTWLNITSHKKAEASATSGGVMLPLWLLGVGTPQAQISGRTAHAVWNASYNTFDITLAKPYHVSRYLIVNPHVGVRGGSIDQHFSVKYAGLTPSDQTTHHIQNDFCGIGARAGLDSTWVIGKGWSLFGNISAALLCGKFEIDQNLSLPGTTAQGFDLDFDYYQNVPNMELALGISWGHYFNKKRNHISLSAAYEIHEWWDQFNARKFSSGSTGIDSTNGIYANDVVSRGNLSLNGFSLKLQLDI